MRGVDRVNSLNRAFTVVFTEAMQSLKPQKDIQKIKIYKPSEIDDEKYSIRVQKWQNAFSFEQNLRAYINNLSNLIILVGNPNSSQGSIALTKELIKVFDSEINSKEFKTNMKSCEPKIDQDPEYIEKKKIWDETFIFPEKLNEFILDLKNQPLPIPAERFLTLIDDFIESFKINDDEFIIKSTTNIGNQEYKINDTVIEKQTEIKINNLISNIKSDDKVSLDNKTKLNDSTNDFIKIMKSAKKNELEIKAEKKIIEKKYDRTNFEFELDEELLKSGAHAVKKMFPQYMNVIAIFSLLAIFSLVVLSIWCPGCQFEPISPLETQTIEKIEIISETEQKKTIITTNILDDSLEPADSIEIPFLENFTIPLNDYVGNPYAEILQSNVVMILVSTFIAPVVARLMKEKFDIEITEKQIGMVMNDGIKSVVMYANEADKLRDSNGNIPRNYQKTLRNKAFNSLRQNYDAKKYKDLVANIGSQIFDKAIEDAVKSGRIERLPIEKKHVEDLIKQSIDATPQIVEWHKLSDDVKKIFIDGNVRKLLQNLGVSGWSYKALENVFDAEISKRIIGAALVEKNHLLNKINSDNPYLKYTSAAIDAVLEQEKKN